LEVTFREYYQHYLTLHQNLWCRRLHFAGQCVTIGYVAFCVHNFQFLMLLAAPFLIYPFAWSGHFFFEKNKPAAFKRPLWAKASDWVMFKDILTGKVKI